MRMRMAALAALFAFAAPAAAVASEGVLILAHNGTPDWNAEVKKIAARVDARLPAELTFGTPTRATIAPAVDRLMRRGATEVLAVPLFLAAAISPEHLTGYRVALRVAPSLAADPVFADVILGRALEVSRDAAGEALVLMGYGGEDEGTRWMVDIVAPAQRLNRARRFPVILTIARPDVSAEAHLSYRLTLDRQVALGRRLVVVPVMMSANRADATIEQMLQGYSYEIATSGVVSDDRIVEWVVTQARTAR